MNRDDDNPARTQPDASGTGAGGGARGGGGDGGDDRDDDERHGRRRRHHHRRYPKYHQDDTQLYGTSGGGTRTQGGGGTQRTRLQDECDRGYEDGLRSGEKDARRGLSSDPQRWTLYRMGGETPSRTGRPADAKVAYRDCFLRGYEEAYRSITPGSGGTSPLN